FFIFFAFAELRILNLLYLLFWVPLVITGAYIILGFGLQDRCLWAYLGTLIFILLMLVVYIGTIILIDNPLYDIPAILHVIIHISILTYLVWHGREFMNWQGQWGIVESG
ncbi:MAG: hypothetical protein ACE5IJ_06745, partial [Thermoplasmata archaeon]